MSTPERPSYQQRTAYHVTLLGMVALLSSAALVIADLQTREPIEAARERQIGERIAQVTPVHSAADAPLERTVTVEHDGRRHTGWQHVEGDAVTAVALESQAQGYGGTIRVIVGIDRDGEILAARVTEHRETPGLGDDIEAERSDWIDAFEGRSLGDPPEEAWAVEKDGGEFDQFTGATITPRAVVEAVHAALHAFEAHQDRLLDPRAGRQRTADGATEETDDG
ncbi:MULTISPECIES: RnfABCDGE type electron transport complex subunit G [unclassified Halorhodospira]|uniref:RnfABCDGE type electron transport complex subunit G n=1 Tax=unclassified Halorhodospira TaxID=2626748 RepID=UPI001EE88C89|nr:MULTISPECIES: RnfABCDGE type electron transport complex subunit G [unclassified Halorhodospira]MCG5540280.1 RnfABCDGE type electron transport complex subunit G [Halorhodospira sp. M39old]MCG5545818.1 RnfABCDGE type electron transport complex subunit G [Halorhodospira sp. M38]